MRNKFVIIDFCFVKSLEVEVSGHSLKQMRERRER